MITAITITKALYKDARCLIACEPGNDLGIDYFIVVEDGEDELLGWGYSAEEAWDDAALRAHHKQVDDLIYKAEENARAQARKEFSQSFAFTAEYAHRFDSNETNETEEESQCSR
jgi:hypothetical protein